MDCSLLSRSSAARWAPDWRQRYIPCGAGARWPVWVPCSLVPLWRSISANSGVRTGPGRDNTGPATQPGHPLLGSKDGAAAAHRMGGTGSGIGGFGIGTGEVVIMGLLPNVAG